MFIFNVVNVVVYVFWEEMVVNVIVIFVNGMWVNY